MLRTRVAVALAAWALLVGVRPLSAAWIVYDNRPAFLSNAGSVNIYGFEVSEGFPAATGGGASTVHSFAGETITTSVPGVAQTQIYPAGSGNQVLGELSFRVAPFAPTPLTLNFAPARRVVGFDVFFPFANVPESVNINFIDGNALSFSKQDSDGNLATPEFFGITSDTPIASITTSGHSASLDGLETLMDNFAVDVPEPSGILAIAGIALTASSRRARPRRTARGGMRRTGWLFDNRIVDALAGNRHETTRAEHAVALG
jgi:hypothetical protein